MKDRRTMKTPEHKGKATHKKKNGQERHVNGKDMGTRKIRE